MRAAVVLLLVLAAGCQDPARGPTDMASCHDALPEGAACTDTSECCRGLLCVLFNRDALAVCCHTITPGTCDGGTCCPIGQGGN